MPLEIGVWRIDSGLERLAPAQMDMEARLQELLDEDITIANPGWMVIGREVQTDFGGRIDILGIDASANLVVVELKRHQTPRDIVAQVLDYGSWVSQLAADRVGRIYQDYLARYHPERPASSLDDAFRARFGQDRTLEALNANHELVIVAASLDPASERIVGYLSDVYGVSINVLFFQVLSDGDRQYLARSWLHDPAQVEPEATRTSARQQWNGEFYVSFGADDRRAWADALKYGFISGGGGAWYSQPLKNLTPGDRVWVHIPGHGFVGVGEVLAEAVEAKEFETRVNGEQILIRDAPTEAPSMFLETEPEYLVGVRWLHTEPVERAVWERGFFANQTTVARPRVSSWEFTVGRLKERFGIS